jgi:hypothetical protein
MKHYRNLPLPSYLEPMSFMGVADDLTSDTRLDEDGVSYIKRRRRILITSRCRLPRTRDR